MPEKSLAKRGSCQRLHTHIRKILDILLNDNYYLRTRKKPRVVYDKALSIVGDSHAITIANKQPTNYLQKNIFH